MVSRPLKVEHVAVRRPGRLDLTVLVCMTFHTKLFGAINWNNFTKTKPNGGCKLLATEFHVIP